MQTTLKSSSISNTSPIEQIKAALQPLLAGGKRPLLIAFDGRSGVGKSTLTRQLAADLGATRIEGDDFYAGGSEAEWDARSAQVKAELCMNWRRMRVECLEPLLAGQPISYHPYDFETGAVLAEHMKTVEPADVLILDGVYSCRPELADLVDFAILVVLENDKRLSRLQARESEYFLREWFKRWDEAEQYYFGRIKPTSSFDLVIQNE